MIPSTHRFITTHAASQSLSHLRIDFRQPSQASRSSGTLQFYSLYYATVIAYPYIRVHNQLDLDTSVNAGSMPA